MYKKISLDYSDLLPYLSLNNLNLHYQIIYENYLSKLNKLLDQNNYNYNHTLPYLVKHLDIFPLIARGDILYNLGAVLNHGLYFYNMSLNNYNTPIGKLKDAINTQYGSYQNFKTEFLKASTNFPGSGYTFLVLTPTKKLQIISLSNQDTPYSYDYIPLIAIDLWEHAYYLDYQADRQSYIDNFLDHLLDYEKVNKLYEQNL